MTIGMFPEFAAQFRPPEAPAEGGHGLQGRVVSTLWVAVLVWLARIGAIYGGSWLGAWFGGTPSEHRLRVWQGMITQVCVCCPHMNHAAA